MVFIRGEEMTKYCMDLIMEQWVEPNVDTSKWEFFDLSCVGRDNTDDQVSARPHQPYEARHSADVAWSLFKKM